ncbi:PIN domain-containing protein [Candidatus Woesearchaeota archaeon]|nr:PIN domain-containing protein [Candidatus Woesearchaeota archaeon]
MEKEKSQERSSMTEVTKEISLIDTNILVYAYDSADPKKQKIAKALLEKCWKRETIYAISAQNLAEFFVVVTQKIPNKMPLENAEQIIKDISTFSNWNVLHYEEGTVQKAIERYKEKKKHFWDAVIVETMKENDIKHIYTENEKDFEIFEEIKAINPFTE